MWIAFRFFIFVLQTQQQKKYIQGWQVVNCFQIFYLCSSNTTVGDTSISVNKLWIAFRFFIFVLQTQRIHDDCLTTKVVNCFQIFYLCSSNTTFRPRRDFWAGCELLSDFLSLFFKHNVFWKREPPCRVVNCFQIFYLCSSNTTRPSYSSWLPELWIAFRFFIFVLQTQHCLLKIFVHNCCELLSDFLSLFFKHNNMDYHLNCAQVVNCFQIFYLCSSNTTEFAQNKDSQALMEIIPK